MTVCYARVSSHDQKADLDRQQAALEAYCATKGWRTRVIRDLGSGMNYRKKGLQELLELILHRRFERLVITHQDRLLRFGAELVFRLCELQGIEIVIVHQGEQPSFEEELAQDVLEIITVFSARLYGSGSHQSKQQLDALANDGEGIGGGDGAATLAVGISGETRPQNCLGTHAGAGSPVRPARRLRAVRLQLGTG